MLNSPAGEGVGVLRSLTLGAVERPFRACFFGPFRVSRDNVAVDAGSGGGRASARTLLKWFLLNPNVHVDSAVLHALLWPDRRSGSNPNRLHVTLHYLRHQLEPELAARHPSSFIHSDRAGRYWFDLADRWATDVAEVEALYSAGKRAEAKGDIGFAVRAYEQLLEYFDRTFLPENLFDEAFDSARTVQEVTHREAESRLLQLYLLGGLAHRALPMALSMLDRDPFSEAASMAIAEVSLFQGNVLAAHAQLEGYLAYACRELGATPSESILRLRERIRQAG